MSNHLYNAEGYANIRWILAQGLPLNLVWGGRGTGKTFGALETVIQDNIKFMFIRRTQTQTDLINRPDFNPFKAVCNVHDDWCIGTAPITKFNSGFYFMEPEDDHLVPHGAPLGYTGALSTFSNIRGFDASDVDLLIFDEFIPERHERPIKCEAEALFNAIETIGRNRELNGKKPLQTLCLANANNVANPLFIYLKLVRKATEMEHKGQEIAIYRDRGIGMFNLCNSPISQIKQETALYRMTGDTEFSSMALANQFNEDASRIKSVRLKEYSPVVVIGELCIYSHKSDYHLYCTGHISGSPPRFGTGSADLMRFQLQYRWIWQKYLNNNIIFEDFECEALLRNYFNFK